LARYNSNGSLDPTFDYDGKVVTDIRDSDYGNAIAIQADGKIVVAGESYTGNNRDFSLARYNSDGSLDPTFDGDGKVVTDIGGTEKINAMLIQPDGRIVVAGTSDNWGEDNYALARYNSDGSLDTTFDGDGKVVTSIGSIDIAYAIAIQLDGKIVVAGLSLTGSNWDFSLARYNSNGSLDPTFDGDGKVVTDLGGVDVALDMAIQPDGRIVAAGESDNPGEQDYALARYNSDGSEDDSFGFRGIVETDIRDEDYGNAIALQADGKIVVAGLSITGGRWDFSLVRYNSDGALDLTFDGDGNVVTDLGGRDDAYAMVIQADGRIVVAGVSDVTDVNFALARYLAYNNAPANITLSNSAVAENQPVGTLVGNLSTTDPDPGDTFTYSFCGGANDGSFQISGNQLRTNAVFDYETKNSYSICIRTNDGHGGTFDKTFTINVMDEAETFTVTFRSVGANDGWVLESSETSNKGGTLDSTATTLRLGDEAGDKQYRAILHFDTSALPESAVITEALLKIKKQGLVGTNPFNILGGLKVDMRKPYFGPAIGLVIGDFQAAAGKKAVSTFVPFPTLGNWYSAGLNAAGRAYVNKSGTTQFRLYFATGDNDDMAADYMKFYSGNAGAASRPQLVIEYYIP